MPTWRAASACIAAPWCAGSAARRPPRRIGSSWWASIRSCRCSKGSWKRCRSPSGCAAKLFVYLAETAIHAVAEKLQRFRGQKINRKDLIESGKTLALVEGHLGSIKLADLCDPQTLVKYDIRPDVLASRDITKTQAVAAALHKEGFGGLRWWSALSGDWHTIVVFQGEIEYGT